jgi:hypothetical protein
MRGSDSGRAEVELTTIITGPRWSTDAQAPEDRGVGPLGVENVTERHAAALVPFATTVTAHARYYALHARIAADGRSVTDTSELILRCEVVLAAASLEHARLHPAAHDPGFGLSRPHGYAAVEPHLTTPSLPVDALAHTHGGGTNGYAGVYLGVELDFGLIGRNGRQLVAGSAVPSATDLAPLDAVLEAARMSTLDVSSMDDPALCVCACRDSADGAALRRAFFQVDAAGTAAHKQQRTRARSSATVLLTALRGHPVSADVTRHLESACCYSDADREFADPLLAHAVARWAGALLRNRSVTAWRWLWWWITDELDRHPCSEHDLGDRLVDTLVSAAGHDGSVRRVLFDPLPPRTHGERVLPAEHTLADEQGYAGNSPLSWLRMLALGTLRIDDLAGHPAYPHFVAGSGDWGPPFTADYLGQFTDRPISELARNLVPKLVRRAQHIARSRQQWTRSGLRLPTRLRPIGDVLYVTGREGIGIPSLRQQRMIHMLGELGVLDIDTGDKTWTDGVHADELA